MRKIIGIVSVLLLCAASAWLVSCGGGKHTLGGQIKGDSRLTDEKVRRGRAIEGAAGMHDFASTGMAIRESEERVRDGRLLPLQRVPRDFNTEEYERTAENRFLETLKNPQSTFSIDVDTASYANVRRFINSVGRPPKDAVRIEELINYFTYDYPQPTGAHPFSFATELSACPWNSSHQLLMVGLQGKTIALEQMPPNNLVFLIDVSGSMNQSNKLPLLKESFKLMVKQLRPVDRVAIVVYAGAAGLVLPSTPGSQKDRIMGVIDSFEAGGSTAGGDGIKLAYTVAKNNFIAHGNNRVILATDGDFNVGVSSTGALERLIEQKRKGGVFLTVLGFGMGNYKDSRMEKLADKGNGNYAYIDTLKEARKVLVSQLGGTLFTIAKDVKLQIEFNPAVVKEYRLIGYENRILAAEDFDNDRKDAGDLGSGHSVTALYELVLADGAARPRSDLRYLTTSVKPGAETADELMQIKFRYKRPKEEQSVLMTHAVLNRPVPAAKTSDNFRFSAAVAEWGLLLKASEHKGRASLDDVQRLASGSIGVDAEGYRAEFLSLVKQSKRLLAR
ncbi:MAG TPA: VWA domain-containing protein [Spirochaetota bacterium]|nr:VWA domain-containing protein [Spirochaetota bacterium]